MVKTTAKELMTILIEDEGINISEISKNAKIHIRTLRDWIYGVTPRYGLPIRKLLDYLGYSIDLNGYIKRIHEDDNPIIYIPPNCVLALNYN